MIWGTTYKGFYVGLMIIDNEPYLVEFKLEWVIQNVKQYYLYYKVIC